MSSDIKYERIFCAEQINVPPQLPPLLKEYSKQVIRENPTRGMTDKLEIEQKLLEWSYAFFKRKLQAGKGVFVTD